MTTNFYLIGNVDKVSLSTIKRTVKALETEKNPSRRVDTLMDLISYLEGTCGKKIHLGYVKDSYPVLFDHNWGDYYNLYRADIKEFIEDNDMLIIDDDDKVYSMDDFWQLVDELNVKYASAVFEEPHDVNFGIDKEWCEDTLGIKVFEGSTFVNDGLRFDISSY